MFKWLEKFLARPYEKAAEKAIIDKTEKPKDISEPVISFVECVKKNPSRFKWTSNKREEIKKNLKNYKETGTILVKVLSEHETEEIVHSLIDLKTGEKFVAKEWSNYRYPPHIHFDYDWMTYDEKEYVRKEFLSIYKQKEERILKIRNYKKIKERQRLMDIYINE